MAFREGSSEKEWNFSENKEQQNDTEKTLYNILRVREDASEEFIKSAYRVCSKHCHPDKVNEIIKERNLKINNDEERKALIQMLTEEFKKLDEAYNTLSDANKRAAYDKGLEERRRTGGQFEQEQQKKDREKEDARRNEQAKQKKDDKGAEQRKNDAEENAKKAKDEFEKNYREKTEREAREEAKRKEEEAKRKAQEQGKAGPQEQGQEQQKEKQKQAETDEGPFRWSEEKQEEDDEKEARGRADWDKKKTEEKRQKEEAEQKEAEEAERKENPEKIKDYRKEGDIWIGIRNDNEEVLMDAKKEKALSRPFDKIIFENGLIKGKKNMAYSDFLHLIHPITGRLITGQGKNNIDGISHGFEKIRIKKIEVKTGIFGRKKSEENETEEYIIGVSYMSEKKKKDAELYELANYEVKLYKLADYQNALGELLDSYRNAK